MRLLHVSHEELLLAQGKDPIHIAVMVRCKIIHRVFVLWSLS